MSEADLAEVFEIIEQAERRKKFLLPNVEERGD